MEETVLGGGGARARARRTKRFLAALAAGLAVLGVAELAARALEPPAINAKLVADPELGFRMPANVSLTNVDEHGLFPYRLNSLGFRGPEIPAADAAAPAGNERVLLVGDSFLNAWAVRDEEWVGMVLEGELARAGAPAEAFALCGDDFGTAQELLLLREYGERVRPSTVVLLLYPGNDIVNNSLQLAGRTPISPGDYFRPYLVPAPGDAARLERRYALPALAALRRSRLFCWAEKAWIERCQDGAELRERLAGGPLVPAHERIAAGELPEEYLELFRQPEPGGAWDGAWRGTEALVRAFRDETERLGARLVVAVIPHLLQVERGLHGYHFDWQLGPSGKTLAELVDWNLPEERLEGFFHREAIRHVQLLEPLRAEFRRSRAALYSSDAHLNGRGHAALSRALADALASQAGGCFDATSASAPVDVAALYPGPTPELDFRAAPRRELFGPGWHGWRRDEAGNGGWPLAGRGMLLVPCRAGRLSLRGTLTAEARFPLRVGLTLDGGKVLASESFDAPGAFELSVTCNGPVLGEPWVPLWVELEGAGPAPALLLERLVVQRLPALAQGPSD